MPKQPVAITLVFLMVWSGLASTGCGRSPSAAVAADSGSARGATAPPTPRPVATPPVGTTASVATPEQPVQRETGEQSIKRLKIAAAIARAAADAAPRDHDDPAAVLKSTGSDPAAILRWVKSETRLVPYAGTLRGPSGVLMDRAGNSLDRALLLADLLHRAGSDVRIARADLAPQVVAALRVGLSAVPAKSAPLKRPDRAALLKASQAAAQVDAASMDSAIDATVKDEDRFAATVRDLYARVAPAMADAIGQDPARDRTIASEADAALRDHFWVQRQAANGWEDLDPDGIVVGTLTPAATFTADTLPRDLRHQVTLRMIVETSQSGKTSETVLLERTWVPSDLLGKPLTLHHRLFPEPKLKEILDTSDPRASYLSALTHSWVFEPMLQIGNEQVGDRLFTLRGQVLPASDQTLQTLGVAGSQPGGFAAGLGQIFGGGAQSPAPAPPDESTSSVTVTAEWIEFEIKVPGRPVERHRRAVFDLVGPSARTAGAARPIDAAMKEQRALAIAGTTDIFIFGATPAEPWLRRIAGEGLATAAEQAASAAQSGSSPIEASNGTGTNRLQLPLWAWALNRSASSVVPPASPVAPNVALMWQTPQRDGVGQKAVRTEFDIVANVTASDLSSAHRLAQGVFDTIVEHAILGDTGPARNTAALYALDLAAGRPWVRLDPGDPKAADRLEISPDAKARMREDLARGYLVLARPRTDLTAGAGVASWWRIDPRTGATLGIGENGMGHDQPEYSNPLVRIALTGVCAFFLIGETLNNGPGVRSLLLAAFCVGGATFTKSVGALVGEGVIDLVVHLITAQE